MSRALARILCRRHCGRCGVDADNRALRQPSGEVDGDGSRTDADVQHAVGRLQPWSRYAAEFSAVRQRCDRRTEL